MPLSGTIVRKTDPDLDVVRLPPNGLAGPCRQRNAALAAAGAPWVLLLDSDAEPEEGCAERLLEAARAHPDVSIVVPSLRRPDGSLDRGAARVHFLGELCFGETGERPAAAASTALLIRREHALRAGGFDESLVFFREDLEFCLRLRLLGYGILHAPEARVRHHRRERGPLHGRRTFYQTRNRWRVLLTLLEARTLALTLPLQLLYEGLNLLLALRQGQAASWLRAHADLIGSLPAILRKRGTVQARRTLPDRAALGAPPLSWRDESDRLGGARAVRLALDAVSRRWWRLV